MPITRRWQKELDYQAYRQAQCERLGHPSKIMHNSGRTPDTGESFETFHWEDYGAEWKTWLDIEEDGSREVPEPECSTNQEEK